MKPDDIVPCQSNRIDEWLGSRSALTVGAGWVAAVLAPAIRVGAKSRRLERRADQLARQVSNLVYL